MKNTSSERLAYTLSSELEKELKSVKKRVKQLEVLYGTQPPAPDPNYKEETKYVAPAPGELLTSGERVLVPVYYSTTSNKTFPYLFFTADNNSTLIIKLKLELLIISDSTNLKVDLFVDDELLDSYQILNPVENTIYTANFANTYLSQTVGHKVHYVVTPETNYSCTYKVVNANYEIIGNNVMILNPPKKHSLYYNDGIYYISKCDMGYSNYLIQSISGLNLNAQYTQHQPDSIEAEFCKSYQKIDGVWQPYELGYIIKNGIGETKIYNFNDSTQSINISNSYGVTFLPNLNFYYGGVVIFANYGNLYYYEVTKNFSSRITRVVESGESYYVNVTGVNLLYNNFNTYPQKAKFVATRLDGTSVFFSEVTNYHKVELGFGTVLSANYANENGTSINVYTRVYNEVVKNVLILNSQTNNYELTSQTVIGTWDYYKEGFPPAYFTVYNNLLTYHAS